MVNKLKKLEELVVLAAKGSSVMFDDFQKEAFIDWQASFSETLIAVFGDGSKEYEMYCLMPFEELFEDSNTEDRDIKCASLAKSFSLFFCLPKTRPKRSYS